MSTYKEINQKLTPNLEIAARLRSQSQLAPYYVPPGDGVAFSFSIALTTLAVSLVACMHNDGFINISSWPLMDILTFRTSTTTYYPLYEGLLGSLACLSAWFINLVHEGRILGQHTIAMQIAFKVGFALFLLSEIMFFFAIFWSYLYFYINPSLWIGGVWPPIGVESLNFLQLPLTNTLILLSSGFSVNWAHRWIVKGKRKLALISMMVTLVYGLLFTWLQFLEYGLATYSINDSIYGSIFYFGTGFHGIHVLLGVMALTIAFYRILFKTITTQHHIGFWAGAIYWHFVDVIWIALYAIFYILGC